jgi:alkanesulfonate monooxygenase SsuD/methylene tetrahydromethanopterin reductase-like flavin-dependent oxidoreductase (luciferase family)
MRVGLTLPFEHFDLGGLPRLLARAEDLGYSEAWSYERNVFDAFSPLGAAAVTTRTMRLGTSIVPVFTRPSGLVAMSAAAIAELAPGRFVLGIGSSTEAIVNGWMGLQFGDPVTRVRESLTAVRSLLRGERVGGMRLHRPPECPVPIYVAALGPRMLRLAGEVADGVVFFLAGPTAVPGLLAATGNSLDSVARVIALTGADHAANLTFARRFIAGYAILPFYARFLGRQGYAGEVRAVQARWKSGDRQGAADEVSDEMAQELMLLATDPCLEQRIARYAAAGLGVLDLWFMSPAGDPDQRRQDTEEGLLAMAPSEHMRAETAGM